MDKRAQLMLSVAKYAAYGGLLWGIAAYPGPNYFEAIMLAGLLVVSGTLRQFVFNGSCKNWVSKWLFFLDIALIAGITAYGYAGLDIMPYFVIVSESVIAASSPVGLAVLLLSAMSVLVTRYPILAHSGWGPFFNSVGVNLLGFVFAFAVSHVSRRQIEQSQELRKTLAILKCSQDELEQAYQELYTSQKRVQELTVVEERSRVLREIHDTLAHTLTAIIVTLEAARKAYTKEHDIGDELSRAQEQARYGLVEVRNSIRNIRDDTLAKVGLPEAVRAAVEHLAASDTVSFAVNMPGAEYLTEKQQSALFRVIREACTNSVRHGTATYVKVSLEREGDYLNLRVEDNGNASADFAPGTGLKGMNERIQLLGGTIRCGVLPAGGFVVEAHVPVGRE